MPKILVVDDDLELRENICEILTQAGFETVSAESAERAAEAVDASTDLVLLDMIMPGMGGMAAIPMLKQRHPSLRIVMVTAFATVENAVEAMRLGADDYVTKPFKAEELLMAVRKNLEEAKFIACRASIDMDQTFSSLSNSMRRDLLYIISSEGHIRFMDLARRAGIDDHTKMNFHLKVLKESGFIKQDAQKTYTLTEEGRGILDCIQMMTSYFGRQS